MNNTGLLYLLIGIAIGYAIGRLDSLIGALRVGGNDAKPQSFFAKEAAAKREKAKVEIDERKYVAAVNTNTLTKLSEAELGKTSVAEDNIQQSVSKLAQLKGK